MLPPTSAERNRTMRITSAPLLLLLSCALAAPADVRAQGSATDTLRTEQQRLLAELGNRYYWPDRRASGGVEACQVMLAGICLAEHLNIPGTQPVQIWNGMPVASSNVASVAGTAEIVVPDRLEEIVNTAADNGWAVGHLAILHSYNALESRALELVRECRSGPGWCDALHAFLLHSYSRYAASDSLFSRALAAMPAAQQCRWRDISQLLDDVARERYNSLPCEARTAIEEKFWWLADPLYMLEGNDRRTEHFSRRVIDSLMQGAPTPFAASKESATWGAALGEMLMRYGIAGHWIVPGKLQDPGARSDKWLHYHTPNYQFVPATLPLDDGLPARGAFALETPLENARERYHPNYDYVATLSHFQVASFPRRDSILVLARMTPGREAFAAAAPFSAALYIAPPPGQRERPYLTVHRDSTTSVSFVATVPRRRALVALELMSSPLLVAARTRFELNIPSAEGAAWITQPVLFAPAANGTQPANTDELFPLMHGSERLLMGKPVGVYWELEGLSAGDSANFQIRVVRTGGSAGSIFSRIFGGRGAQTSVLRWPATEVSKRAHSVTIDVGNLREGTYTLELVARGNDGTTVRSERSFELLRRDPSRSDMTEALQQEVPKESQATLGANAPRVRPRSAIRR
jgi:hypothetical protein